LADALADLTLARLSHHLLTFGLGHIPQSLGKLSHLLGGKRLALPAA
jgi:hypothetical protein